MQLSGRTTVAAVIGSPVRHSLSPTLHNAGFAAAGLDWVFTAFDVAAGEAGRALDGMRALGLGGLSVTMPHKGDVAAAVDERSEAVERLGAANCVVPLGDGRLRAESTDGEGFLRALVDAGVAVEGHRVAVVGAGGAARAVVLAVAGAGAGSVVVVNRSEDNARRAAALAGSAGSAGPAAAIGDAEVVVNATPVGMGDAGGLPFDASLLGAGQTVVDLVYQPVRTPLLDAAATAGCRAVDGLGMLLHQAAIAFEHWTGEAAPLPAMRSALAAAVPE
jgi:shikimate dehydrogenase